jgi:hypothetical protein
MGVIVEGGVVGGLVVTLVVTGTVVGILVVLDPNPPVTRISEQLENQNGAKSHSQKTV